MTISYFLNNARKQNLYCRISDGNEKVAFSLGYAVPQENWDSKSNMLVWNDKHNYTLKYLKENLQNAYDSFKAEGKDCVLDRLKSMVADASREKGIDGITEWLFDKMRSDGVPAFKYFVAAFKKHFELKDDEYSVEPFGDHVVFTIEESGEEYILETWAGKRSELKNAFEARDYEYLTIDTDFDSWDQVIMDGLDEIDNPIGKQLLFPEMFNQWKMYWGEQFDDMREKGRKTEHLAIEKEDSWKAFQLYLALYDSCMHPVIDAYNIAEELAACVILSIPKIYDLDTCLAEYCEFYYCGSDMFEHLAIDENDCDEEFYMRPFDGVY